jgi:hypothetical protein
MRVGHDIVVAAHPLHARAERAVRVEERRELRFAPGVGEIAFHDDGIGIEGAHLVDHGAVHDLGVRRVAGLGAQDRSELLLAEITDPSALHLPEVHVIGGRDRRQKPARRTRERRERRRQPLAPSGAVDVELVLRLRLQADDARAVIWTRRGDLGVADPCGHRLDAIGAERHDRLVGTDGHELGVVHDHHGRTLSGARAAPDSTRQAPRPAQQTGAAGAEP